MSGLSQNKCKGNVCQVAVPVGPLNSSRVVAKSGCHFEITHGI